VLLRKWLGSLALFPALETFLSLKLISVAIPVVEPLELGFQAAFVPPLILDLVCEPARALPEGATTAPPPTQAEIEKLLEIAPRYGIELRLPATDAVDRD
jgi:hypothetical protein